MTGRDIPSYTVAYAVETGGKVDCRVKSFYFVDPQTIRQELRRQGAHPLSIRKKRKSLRDYFTRTDKSWQIRILRAIATHVSKEASPGRVLQDLISMQDDARAHFLLAPAAQMLRRGGTFVEALKATGVFDSTTLAILRAGQESRTIRDVIKYAVLHIEERGQAWKQLLAASSILWMELCTSVTAVVGTYFGFLPWLEHNGIAENAQPEQIAAFKNALWWGYVINGALMWLIIVVTMLGTVVSMLYSNKDAEPDHWSARLLAATPVVGKYLRNVGIAQTFSTLARLLRGGVDLIQSFQITERSANVLETKAMLRVAIKRLKHGSQIAGALTSKLLSKLEVFELAAMPDYRKTADLLESIAQARVEDSKRSRRSLLALGMAIVMAYSIATALTALWILWVQNQGMMDSLNAISRF